MCIFIESTIFVWNVFRSFKYSLSFLIKSVDTHFLRKSGRPGLNIPLYILLVGVTTSLIKEGQYIYITSN